MKTFNPIKLALIAIICFLLSVMLNAQITLTETQGTTPSFTLRLQHLLWLSMQELHQGDIVIGDIVIKVNSSTTESSAVLNASGSGASSYSAVNIYPRASCLSITSNNGAPFIYLRGITHVTIDGWVNATVLRI